MIGYVVLFFMLFGFQAASADSLFTDLQTEIVKKKTSTSDTIRLTFDSGMAKDIPINYEAGTSSDRFAKVIADPTLAGNRVLQYWMKNAKIRSSSGQFKGRIQMSFLGLNQTTSHYNYSMYLHPDLALLRGYPKAITWFTIGELWVGKPLTHPYPFRISIDIGKEAGVGKPLIFFARGPTSTVGGNNWTNVWVEANTSFQVPTGEWMDVEVGYEQGDQQTGRFNFTVGGVPILDVTNWTYHPDAPNPVPLTMVHPLKLYTSDDIINYIRGKGKVAQIYWDDLEMAEVW